MAASPCPHCGEELPAIENVTDDDLQLAISALPTNLRIYGGFIRAALAGIYAEQRRARRAEGEL